MDLQRFTDVAGFIEIIETAFKPWHALKSQLNLSLLNNQISNSGVFMLAKFLSLILFSFFVFTNFATAQVWNHDSRKEWNEQYQVKYANWVSSKLGTDFFGSLGRPYSNLRLDCADAHYALLAYFARQEGLPYFIDGGRVNNLTTEFNNLQNPSDRFVAFVRKIAGNYGTESLVAADTYPISFQRLRPGDLFMYKIGSQGNFTRHAYIIKNINPDGTFDVVYSTQAAAAAGRPLNRKQSYMFSKAPTNTGRDRYRWGFRRAKPAQYAHLGQDQIPGADFMQYPIADQYKNDPAQFFRVVKQANQTVQETPQRLIGRHMDNLCRSLNDRIDIVNQALRHQNQIGGQCMAFQDFDAHSTPSRDSGLGEDFMSMAYDYKTLANSGQLNRVGRNYLDTSTAALTGRRSQAQNQALNNFCKIQFANQQRNHPGFTNIGMFFDALFDLDVSYHPNDNVFRRWGFPEGRVTSCQAFYGYARRPERTIRF